MTPAVYAALTANHGLITRRQSVAAGLAPDDVDALVKRGAWVAVRRGVYAEREVWERLDSYREQTAVAVPRREPEHGHAARAEP